MPIVRLRDKLSLWDIVSIGGQPSGCLTRTSQSALLSSELDLASGQERTVRIWRVLVSLSCDPVLHTGGGAASD